MPSTSLARLGLPDTTRACLFDLDGVLTQTSLVHAAAWKQMFDGYLQERAGQTGQPFVPFDAHADYTAFVDGKPRADGTRSFLASRGIELPEGTPDDSPTTPTINGLGNRKNELVLHLIDTDGVKVYDGSVRFVHAVRAAGLRTAVVSSSANTEAVLKVTGIADLFDARVDAITARRDQLKGKPAPDTFLAGARAVGVEPGEAVVFEDAIAGVQAGRAGHFALVVGVDRAGQAAALAANGADVVVADLDELMKDGS